MRKYFVCGVSGFALLTAAAFAQSGQSNGFEKPRLFSKTIFNNQPKTM